MSWIHFASLILNLKTHWCLLIEVCFDCINIILNWHFRFSICHSNSQNHRNWHKKTNPHHILLYSATCFTVCPSVPLHTEACVLEDAIITGGSIQTGVTVTLVDVWKENTCVGLIFVFASIKVNWVFQVSDNIIRLWQSC